MDNTEFVDIWMHTWTAREAAQQAGLTTRQANKLARELDLPQHESGSCLTKLSSDDLLDWDVTESVEEFASTRNISTVLPNLQKINAAAQRSGYPSKKLKATAKTSQGVSSQDIVASWIDWWRDNYVAPLTQGVIRSVAREVRELIVAGYEAPEIKMGIWKWSVAFLSQGYPPPMRMIQQIAYRARLQSSPESLGNLQRAQIQDQQIDAVMSPRVPQEIEVREW